MLTETTQNTLNNIKEYIEANLYTNYGNLITGNILAQLLYRFLDDSFDLFEIYFSELEKQIIEKVIQILNETLDKYYTKEEIDSLFDEVSVLITNLTNSFNNSVSEINSKISKIENTLENDTVSFEDLEKCVDKRIQEVVFDSNSAEDIIHNLKEINDFFNSQVEQGITIANIIESINSKVSKDDVYSKEEIDEKFSTFVPGSGNEGDNDLSNYYTKDEVYNKTEVDNKVSTLGSTSIKYLTQLEYTNLQNANQISDTIIYVVTLETGSKVVYIGHILLGKDSQSKSASFPYAFPIIF
jgi:hypothetical protein